MSSCGGEKETGEGGKREGTLSSSDKATVLLAQGSTLMVSFNLHCLLKSLCPDTVTSRVRVSTYGFWEDHN